MEEIFLRRWEQETTDICRIRTYRQADLTDEEVNKNLIHIREYFKALAAGLNTGLTALQLTPFQWCMKTGEPGNHDPTDAQCLESKYWIFGFRFGAANPTHKLSLICHLDTVPASDSSVWAPFDPFEPETDKRPYEGGTVNPQEFLVGRGCIDDKGPAVSAFIVARALAKEFDGSTLMDSTQVEIIFDTSEETDMSTPRYLEDKDTVVPDFGVVYDAQWCVRAEKGCERPKFTVNATEAPADGSLYIRSLTTTPANSSNTIPDWAEAKITGNATLLADFANSVCEKYERAEFDDKSYRKSELKVTPPGETGVVTLQTFVEGAQHGSAPEENRKNGANPLVSLANFLAGLVSDGTLAVNAGGTICEFIRWTWGTHVFGEAHGSLYKYDDVFEKGNGTTYAVTKVETASDDSVKLEIDIRYAIDHHETEWDGKTEGLLEGDDSVFEQVFSDLVREFNEQPSNYPTVMWRTETMFGPDIRVPDTNPDYLKVEEAYEKAMGMKPPRYAIGGGTDAKGYTFLLAVGPLMAKELGPPINYHGIGEGAPKADLCKSTEILFNLFKYEIETPVLRAKGRAIKALNRVQQLRKKGNKFCCNF